MVISHKHQYLFVELPHTASTAISRELCEKYGGTSILHKHAHYSEFLRIARPEEKDYFVFAGIRNPLDVVVTLYFKRKTNHQGFYTDPKYWQVNGGHVSNRALREFRFIRERNADFADYFREFYKLPYDSWGSPSPQDFDFIIRYESLQADFAAVLKLLSIEQIRPLPTVNKTSEKAEDFVSYYTPDMFSQARKIFGPYMNKWNYDFPLAWGDEPVPFLSRILYQFLSIIRKHFIWNESASSRTLSRFRRVFCRCF